MINHDDQIVLQSIYVPAWTNASYDAFTHHTPQPLGGAYRLAISIIPSAIAICVLAFRVIKPLIPKRPRWMTNFVSEPSKQEGDLTLHGRKQDSIFLSALLIASSSGLALQIVPGLYPKSNYNELLPILAWAIAILLITIDRPKTAPFGVLVVMIGLFVMRVTLLLQLPHHMNSPGIAHFAVLLMISLMISVILFMPMRSPQFSSVDISPANGIPTADLRSPEDNLTLLQYMTVSWMGPLISLGSARKLEPEDIWSLSYQFQHKILHEQFRDLKGSVVRRLLAANGLDLILISSLAVITCLARMSVPVLLQQLLRAMEYPGSPRREAITYAALSMLARFISIQASVFKLWYARRCYERSRGEMITMIFEKTLARKIIGAPKKEENDTQTNGFLNGTAGTSGRKSRFSPVTFWRKFIGWIRGFFKSKAEEKTKEPASMGKILNLMRNDVYEVSQRFWEFGQFITTPLTFIFSIILIWKLIGWPCLIGVVTIFVAQGFNAIITRILLRWEKERRKLTDTRLKKVSEFVEAIRHLRWYGWQDFWKDRIMASRQQELQIRVITSLWRMGITFVNTFASGLFPVVAFYTYTVWAGLPLRIDIAFPALQLFNMLEGSLRQIPDLITTLLNAKIAVDRIEDFMSEPDKDTSAMSTNSSESRLGLQQATFAWPGTSDPVLSNINLTFPVGLTLMYGKVAAGKSALLQALLGELDRLGGEVSVPNEMFGYCSQTPWLQSMNIRDNILFSSPYEESRYNETLAACALTQDLAGFKDGDLSNIGENGIGLSGGQKARVALARAVYSRAKILLLDDPLSALDHQTAETIVRRCLNGSLTKGRIVVLVTHRTELCHDIATQMVEIAEGTAQAVDRETVSSNDLTRMLSRESTENATEKETKDGGEETTPDKFIEDEKREHGGVRFSVYWEYIKAGKLTWWAILVLVLAFYRLVDVGETWFLKQWGESYNRPTEQSASGLFDSLPSPGINIRPWLIGFFLFALVQAIGYFITQCFMLVIIYLAGRQMFRDIMTRFSHATFRFYDITPVGRLMNRMTSDIGTIDGNISYQLTSIVWLLIKWIASVVIIASVTPIFFAVAIALSVCFVLIFRRFLPTSQSLRRLEMVSLSPLMSNFGALLEGLVTVRAFAVQSKFQDGVIEVTDAFQRMDHFYWSLQSWLTYRFESLSAVSTFLITLLALYTGVSAGLTAFLLTAASQFVAATHGLCRQYGSLQMDFVSVERVVELLHLDQEPPGTIDPPASWPSYSGDIVFEDVSMRYAENLEPSLSDVSCCIPAGSTAALLGRTGSGKSTFALSLLATIRPESGRILIDSIDISKVSTQALRNRITFLAQDPVLFPGTMRQNLDPLDEYTDDACSGVLERVCSTHGWTLDTQVDAGGKNLSQGQRQLVGLARAVLRRSAIVILDEATASIDTETALQIQQILREELRESTVITIAHRLEAVKDADFFIKLDKGRLAGAGPALEEGVGEGSSSNSNSGSGSGTPKDSIQ